MHVDKDKINVILHFMACCQPFSKIFKELIINHKKWCCFLQGDKISCACYNANPALKNLFCWLEKYIICCKFLDTDRYAIDEMNSILINLKNPESLKYYKEFRSLINRLKQLINFIELDISKKLGRFTCSECKRLDEAVVCFINYSYYACIIMAVSAVETRIHENIKKTDKDLYHSIFETLTLGQLVKLFDEDEYKHERFRKLKKMTPEKHKPLINLLNRYRVFSVHPKEEILTPQIAEAIMHLSFTFLLDPATFFYKKEELVCK